MWSAIKKKKLKMSFSVAVVVILLSDKSRDILMATFSRNKKNNILPIALFFY